MILDGEKGPFSVGANIGGAYRAKAQIGTAEIGSEGRYSVAAGYRIGPVIRVIADMFGTTRFSSAAGENTLEIDGGPADHAAQFTAHDSRSRADPPWLKAWARRSSAASWA